MWTTTDNGTTRSDDDAARNRAERRSAGPGAGCAVAAVALATLTTLVVAPVGPAAAAARPPAPASVTAQPSADRSATLTAVVSDAQGRVDSVRIRVVGSTRTVAFARASSYRLTGLAADATYTFRLAAHNRSGWGPSTVSNAVKVPPVGPPVAPPPAGPGTPVLVDGFQDLSGWSVYHGVGSYSAQGPRVRTNVEVRDEGGRRFARVWTRPLAQAVTIDGRTLRAGEMAAGGMAHRLGNRTYGRWTMQMRAGSSTNTRVAVMLWGVGSWPAAGELDFFESGADQGTRQAMNITNHWAGPDGRNAQSMRKVTADFTQWHDWEVVWAPNLYTVSVDGVVVARYTEHVPNGKMFLAVQTAIAGGSPAPAGTTSGYVDVADLKVYAR